MRFNPEIHRRHSVRLKGYDYTEPGAYFVTICTWNRECLFGEICDGKMLLSGLGEVVSDEWCRTATARSHVTLDEFSIMPNHVHGILCIDHQGKGKARLAPTTAQFGHPVAGSLAMIIGAFKSASTKRINKIRNMPGASLWQRNYYEHIVRSERELTPIREYIATNAARWSEDSENPNYVGKLQCDVALQKICDGSAV
ncbi:MAG: transposase [Candidatus Binatia bacterium]